MFHSLQQRTSRKLLAALCFGVFGFLAVAIFFLHLPIAFRGLFLYVLLPTIASALAGFLWGGAILDPARTEGYGRCLLRGLGVTAGAFAIFAALFASVLPLTERGWAFNQVWGIFLSTLFFGLMMTGPIIAPAGMLGAVTLYLLGRILPDLDGQGPQPIE